jgi:hypothetical protein
MGRIARTVFRLLFAVLSLFTVPHAFPAFLYQTPAVQEYVLQPPHEGPGGPLIVYWTHLIGPPEVRPLPGPQEAYEALYEDADLHPDFPIDVWMDSEQGLLRLRRGGAAGNRDDRVEIEDGCLRTLTARDPTGRTLLVFKAVSGEIAPEGFDARDYFPEWPPAWS